MHKPTDVIAIGNTLMDFLVEVNDQTLIELDLQKNETHFVDEEKGKELLQKIKDHQLQVEIVPGGSAANTMRCLGLLGATVTFTGKVGQDEHGEMYVEKMQAHNVQTNINNHTKTTGHALTFITPDSERTFSVHLGASIELVKDDVLEEQIAQSKILHLEGYQLEGQTKDVILHALEFAKKHHTLVSLDLSDPGIIRRNKELLQQVVQDHVDILFVNEYESREYTGMMEEEAVKFLGQHCMIAIVKRGELGSLISYNGTVTEINPFPADPVDTTGAGDTYAAGFLYGFCKNWNMTKAGKLGSLLAAKIVEQKGVKFNQQKVQLIRDFVD